MIASDARDIAERIVTALAPACHRIEIAGSLRRRRPEVGDIDLVLIPRSRVALEILIRELYGRKPEKSGEHYLMLKSFDGIQVDLYLATPATWATLLLIRTGSKAHNITLCQRARKFNLKLHANGDGMESLCGHHPLIAIEREEQVFTLLALPYREPWERD
jgi:DNA polymerase/3'-5' exonuclease PolX